jgi:hypothetical protein
MPGVEFVSLSRINKTPRYPERELISEIPGTIARL